MRWVWSRFYGAFRFRTLAETVGNQRPNPGRREHEDAALACRNARGVQASALGWASVRECPLEDVRPELAGADEFSVLCQSQPHTGP